MKETWRWFGPADKISISEIRQTDAAVSLQDYPVPMITGHSKPSNS